MDPNSNQQPQAPMPGNIPGYGGQQAVPTPGMPYVPEHTLADTAANIQGTVPANMVAQTQQYTPSAPAPMPMPHGQVASPGTMSPGYASQAGMLSNAPITTGQGSMVTAAPPVVAPGHPGAPGVKPVPQTNPNSTQNTLQIAEIRDGIVIMNDGSYRSVLMVKSINFDLMSQQEQEAVEYSFQGFLNSLYFPVQIFIRSQKVDLQPYIEKLDKIRNEHDNMLLALLMDDYITYIDSLAQQTNIMDKKFYVVVPFFPHQDIQKALTQSKNFVTGLAALFGKQEQHVVINEPDLEKAKTELRNRVQAVLQGLLQCGVQGLPLDTQELIELFYDTYNPDTATRQQLKNFNTMNADVITKGQGKAAQPHLQRELG